MKYCGVGWIILAAVLLIAKRQTTLKQGERIWKETVSFLEYLNGKLSFEGSPLWNLMAAFSRTRLGESTLFSFEKEKECAPHEAVKTRLEVYDISIEEKEMLVHLISMMEEQTGEDTDRNITSGISQALKMLKNYEERIKKERSTTFPLILAWAAMLILVLL